MLIPAATIAAPPSAQCGLSALPSFGDTLASSMSIMSIAEPSQSPGQIVVSTKASLAPNTLLNAQIRMQVDSEDISADPSKSSTNIFTMPSLVGEMVNPTNGHLALATPPRLSPKVAAKKDTTADGTGKTLQEAPLSSGAVALPATLPSPILPNVAAMNVAPLQLSPARLAMVAASQNAGSSTTEGPGCGQTALLSLATKDEQRTGSASMTSTTIIPEQVSRGKDVAAQPTSASETEQSPPSTQSGFVVAPRTAVSSGGRLTPAAGQVSEPAPASITSGKLTSDNFSSAAGPPMHAYPTAIDELQPGEPSASNLKITETANPLPQVSAQPHGAVPTQVVMTSTPPTRMPSGANVRGTYSDFFATVLPTSPPRALDAATDAEIEVTHSPTTGVPGNPDNLAVPAPSDAPPAYSGDAADPGFFDIARTFSAASRQPQPAILTIETPVLGAPTLLAPILSAPTQVAPTRDTRSAATVAEDFKVGLPSTDGLTLNTVAAPNTTANRAANVPASTKENIATNDPVHADTPPPSPLEANVSSVASLQSLHSPAIRAAETTNAVEGKYRGPEAPASQSNSSITGHGSISSTDHDRANEATTRIANESANVSTMAAPDEAFNGAGQSVQNSTSTAASNQSFNPASNAASKIVSVGVPSGYGQSSSDLGGNELSAATEELTEDLVGKTEKKSAPPIQNSSLPNAATSNFSVPADAAAHSVSPAVVSGRDGATPAVAVSGPAASGPEPPVAPAPSPQTVLPKAHQMLDSPVSTAASATSSSAANPATAEQLNAQMHVGVRTDAFGTVEIHTVVQQSQIGLTVHADRDIVRWFSSEIPSLGTELGKSHLNLTGVDFQSGAQTAGGFQQGQPRQTYSQPQNVFLTNSRSDPAEDETPSEIAAPDILPARTSPGTAKTHVSIHV